MHFQNEVNQMEQWNFSNGFGMENLDGQMRYIPHPYTSTVVVSWAVAKF